MTDEAPLDEPVDPLQSLGKAAESAAKKDDLTVTVLQMVRRSWRVMGLAVLIVAAGIGYGDWQSNDQNMRSARGYTLLVCVATSQRTLAQDLRTAVSAKRRVPASAIKIPAGCTLVP